MGEVLSVALDRAKQVLEDGDLNYSRFLCYETLKHDVQNSEARKYLQTIRLRVINSLNFSTNIQQFFKFLKIKLYQLLNFSWQTILYEIEKYTDLSKLPENGLRWTAEIAINNDLIDLMILALELIPEDKRTEEDILNLAKAYLELKNFDYVLGLTGILLENFPENIEARDIANEASMLKSTTATPQSKKNKQQPIDISSLIPTVPQEAPKPQPRNGQKR